MDAFIRRQREKHEKEIKVWRLNYLYTLAIRTPLYISGLLGGRTLVRFGVTPSDEVRPIRTRFRF